jgi:hypothetical protein
MQLNEYNTIKFLCLGTWGSLWSTQCLENFTTVSTAYEKALYLCFIVFYLIWTKEIISIQSASTYSPA